MSGTSQPLMSTRSRFYDIDDKLRDLGFVIDVPSHPTASAVPPQVDFEYEALEADTSIRLLQLDPAADEDAPLVGQFVDRADTALQYEAISYMWGAPVFPDSLHIAGGGSLGITANLAAALRRFRLRDESRTLWADAVCIDQSNVREKQQQVAVMADIYKNASQVLIWLGHDVGHDAAATQRAMDGMRYLARWLIDRAPASAGVSALGHGATERELAPALLYDKQPFAIFADASIHDLHERILSDHVGAIYTSPYFSRMWIVQEIALASSATIYQGRSAQLDWPTFAVAMIGLKAMVDGRFNMLVYDEKMLRRAAEIAEVRLMYLLSSDPSPRSSVPTNSDDEAGPFGLREPDAFGASMHKLRGQGCTDDRDRIYALLSLQTANGPRPRVHLEPDYSVDIIELMTSFTRKVLQSGRLELLYAGGLWERPFAPRALQASALSLPSWVPDFRSHNNAARQLSWLRPYVDPRSYVALADSSAAPLVGGEGRQLELQVYGAMVIKHVLAREFPDPNVHFGDEKGSLEVTREHVLACRALLDSETSSSEYPLGGDVDEAFWSTMVTYSPLLTSQTVPGMGGMVYTPSGLRDTAAAFTRHVLDEDGAVWKDRWNVEVNRDYAMRRFAEEDMTAASAIMFYRTVRDTVADVAFFVSADGLMGLSVPGTREGDMVVFVEGTAHPLVLRPVRLPDGAVGWVLLGSCYLAGYDCRPLVGKLKYETVSLY